MITRVEARGRRAGAQFQGRGSVALAASGTATAASVSTTLTVGVTKSGWSVEQTGKNQAHHTVHLPKPVTDEVTQSLNEAFGGG